MSASPIVVLQEQASTASPPAALAPLPPQKVKAKQRLWLETLWRQLGIPMLAIAVFLFAWSQAASRIQTSLGQIPGPIAVAKQAQSLRADHQAERAKAAAFYERQEKRNAARLAKDPNAEIKKVK